MKYTEYIIIQESDVINNERFECKICGQRKRSASNMKYHLSKFHTDVEPIMSEHKCKICDFKHSVYLIVAQHMKRIHDSEEMFFTCTLCSYKNESQYKLKIHVERVHMKLRQKCDECPFVGYQTTKVKNHKLVVHEGLRYKCDNCPFVAVSQMNLKMHTKNYHMRILCELCNFTIAGEKLLKEHMIEIHEDRKVNYLVSPFESLNKDNFERPHHFSHQQPQSKTTFNCNLCHYETSDYTCLQRHTIKHERKYFNCDQCIFKSQRKSNLRHHILLTHKLTQKINILVSNFEKTHKSLLKKHNTNIKAELILGCNSCEFKTHCVTTLKKHQRKHNNKTKVIGKINKTPEEVLVQQNLKSAIDKEEGQIVRQTNLRVNKKLSNDFPRKLYIPTGSPRGRPKKSVANKIH